MSGNYSSSQGDRSHDRRHALAKYLFKLPAKIAVVLLFLCSCNPSENPERFEGVAMTIPYCLQVGQTLSEKERAGVEAIILSTFAEINTTFNNWNPDSELSKLNNLPAQEKVALSPSLNSFLNEVNTLVALTEGRFDPTVAPLHLLWKNALKEGKLPPNQSAEAEAVGWHKIHIENGFFWKDDPVTALDLCGVAKGYAVDLLAERLEKAGYRNLYIEWGGEIRTVGEHPHQRPWKIGIEGLSAIELTNQAVATSGSYIQSWVVEGATYTHILDPRTREPLRNAPITSVSVIAPTCAEADALATALMLFSSKEEAHDWAKERGLKIYVW